MKKIIGYIGLGKMGYAMCERLREKKWRIVAYNRTPEKALQLAKKYRGIAAVKSLKQLIAGLKAPRVIWIMLPNAAVAGVVQELLPLLTPGDILIDGGNTYYKDTVQRSKKISARGIEFLDVGVSGGPGGARTGACMMIGGAKGAFKKCDALFRDACIKNGYGYFGKSGAGHFVKMVHNGIEYGMMQAIAEGFAVMQKSIFRLDLTRVASVYNNGSVITSRLMGWLEKAFEREGVNLKKISGKVAHSGEGQWTVEAAKGLGIDVPIIQASLAYRLRTQKKPDYTGKILSALRNQFGGHEVKTL